MTLSFWPLEPWKSKCVILGNLSGSCRRWTHLMMYWRTSRNLPSVTSHCFPYGCLLLYLRSNVYFTWHKCHFCYPLEEKRSHANTSQLTKEKETCFSVDPDFKHFMYTLYPYYTICFVLVILLFLMNSDQFSILLILKSFLLESGAIFGGFSESITGIKHTWQHGHSYLRVPFVHPRFSGIQRENHFDEDTWRYCSTPFF